MSFIEGLMAGLSNQPNAAPGLPQEKPSWSRDVTLSPQTGTSPVWDPSATAQAIGNAQNTVNAAATSNSGYSLSGPNGNTVYNEAGSAGGAGAGSAAGALGNITGNPFVGSVAGALGGNLGQTASQNFAGQTVSKLTSKLNLTPMQNFLGQGQTAVTTSKNTFGFLFPSGDQPQVSYLGQTTPLGKDGNVKYDVAPFIPTLTHHAVRWQAQPQGVTSFLGVHKSQAIASRMSFSLEARNFVMSLLVSPRSVNISRSQVMSQAVSRSGFIINPTGPGEFDVSVSGTTAGFYDANGLTSIETNTIAYSNLLLLYNFFANNGYMLCDEPQVKNLGTNGVRSSRLDVPSPTDVDLGHRINSMSYVSIEWQKWKWWGFFKSFKVIDVADAPYTLNYEFVFRVCHESDKFKIDNSIGSAPPVTGHVVQGFSAERALAAKSVGGTNPLAADANTSTHKNATMPYSFDETTPIAIALDPRKTLAQSAQKLSLGGYNLNFSSGADGMRFFGSSPDGVAVDLSQMDGKKGFTVVPPGSSPVRYVNSYEQGNGVITGVIQQDPTGQKYSYTQPGQIPPATPH